LFSGWLQRITVNAKTAIMERQIPMTALQLRQKSQQKSSNETANSSSNPNHNSKITLKLDQRITTLTRKILASQGRLARFQSLRLTVGITFFIALIIAVAKPTLRLEPILIGLFLAVFSPLVIASSRYKLFIGKLTALKSFLERQKARAIGQAPERNIESATKYAETHAQEFNHSLSRDLGTLGPLSLFTLLDETLTDQGEQLLLRRMAQTPESVEQIIGHQTRIKLLKNEAWLYTRLILESHSAEFRLSSETALDTLKHSFVPDGFNTRFAINLSAWILALIGFAIGSKTGAFNPGMPFLIYTAVGFWTMNRSEGAFNKGVGLENHLWLLAPLFARIEKRAQQSKILQSTMPVTTSSGPSIEMKKLGRILSFAGVQANPILFILVNAVLPWSITTTYLLERRRRHLKETLPQCLTELAEFEVDACLMLLERYQTNVYPEISSEIAFKSEGIYHPLLNRSQVIANDFSFPNGKSLGLLTGSNMSGKSTFLRTIGLNQILANMGGPVFAKSLTTTVLRIESCIEVSDSLRDGFSYFYAEVRRLRDLIKTAQATQTLYLIDEIFRGTNNRERQIGSRAVIRALALTNSIGFISTHDLELTELEGGQPKLLNLHFREEIREGLMHFTYSLHEGPCPTTNALRIMEAEGIDVSGF
jgi:hypothetical protein